ncbi:MAG: leader peptidase (prepilin peptidase) / N-methyltransferase [Patescibacteria group bacterium]|nr:leader peptidase (prepilin peptidase) / N-methyltransferase [Patescibacteria group bacterium]
MNIYYFVFLFIFLFGTIIGSFLNVVIYRLNTSKKIVNSRSVCFSCNKTLYWYELIPVLSFLIQKGRCRGCASRISHQYPIVEVVTGIVFTILAYHFLPLLYINTNLYVFYLSYFVFIFSILIVITVYDIRHKIIPDRLVYMFIFISFVLMFLNTTGVGEMFVIPSLLQFVAGPLLALPFALIWLLSKGTLIGFGDSKLILGIGWMLGISIGLSALFISFWLGALFGVVMLALKKMKVNMKTEIPFAPFLVIGCFIAFIFQIGIFKLSELFIF